MERRQTKLYRLIDLRNGRVWDFDRARQLVNMMFVLTMWSNDAAIYKNGARYTGGIAGGTSELTHALEMWNP